jgi:hypothetical protein
MRAGFATVLAFGALAAASGEEQPGQLIATERSSYVLVDWGPSEPSRDVYHVFMSQNGSGRQHVHSTTGGTTWTRIGPAYGTELRRGSLYCFQVSTSVPAFYRTARDCVRW